MRFHPVSLGGIACVLLCGALAQVRAFPNGNWLLASLVVSGMLVVLPAFFHKSSDLSRESDERHKERDDV